MPPLTTPTPPPPPPHTPILKYIAIAILALIILTASMILTIWLVIHIHPKNLKYSIEHASINNNNLTNNHLKSNFHFLLKANNDNGGISLYYDMIDVILLYKNQRISMNNVGPFYQRRRNVKYLDLDMEVKDAVIHTDVARSLSREWASGYVRVDLRIVGKVRVKVGVFKTKRRLNVICGSLVLPVPNLSKGFHRVVCDVHI